MYRFNREYYLASPEGLLAQHRRRDRRRIHFSIDDIEPRQESSMSDRDKDEVQKQLLEWLTDLSMLTKSRLEAAIHRIDIASKWRADVTGERQRTSRCTVLEHHAAACARLLGT